MRLPRNFGRSLVQLVCLSALTCAQGTEKPSLYETHPLPPAGSFVRVTPALYDTTRDLEKTVEIKGEDIANMKFMGAQVVTDASGNFRGTNFAVFSQRAEKMQLLIFDNADSERPTRTFELSRTKDVWNVFVEGIGLGQHYGFIAWGPNWVFDEKWHQGLSLGFVADVDFAGNRFNPNKLLTDPYCKAFSRDHDWSKASLGTGPQRTEVTYGASMKCVVVKSEHKWTQEEQTYWQKREDPNWVGHRWTDLILYEVHAKGFTANSASGVEHFGTYRGFGEKADYLKNLGITAVELMPPFEMPLDAGYWGYNSLGFFAPELSFSSKRRLAEVIDEFKWMVEELHKRNIEVLVDVVYNHTGEGGLWRQKIYERLGQQRPVNIDPQDIASLYSFRGLDNASYYALPPGVEREYCDYTGVGNTVRANTPVMQRLILDSLRYWVEEMHVDGFRFDLAPALGARDPFFDKCPTSANKIVNSGIWFDPANSVLQQIIDDPVMQRHNTRIIAEPWGGGAYGVGNFTSSTNNPAFGWAEWNATFRDWSRSFVNYDDWGLSNFIDGGNMLTGSSSIFASQRRRPYHAMNFVTVHDGFTMYDLLTYDQKVNDCSPINPVCCNAPLSAQCDEAKNSGTDDNRSRDWFKELCRRDYGACGFNPDNNQITNGERYLATRARAEDFKRQLMRNFFTMMMVSQGTPLLFGGDEWMRTQLGNNNTYTPESDNAFSWHDWGSWPSRNERTRMHDFVSKVIAFRKTHAAFFSPDTYDSTRIEWKAPSGGPAMWGGSRQLMIHFSDASAGKPVVILLNMSRDWVPFQLPAGTWQRVLDTQQAFDSETYLQTNQLPLTASANISLDAPEKLVGAEYSVPERTIVVLEAQ